jgi:hypothetical protein
MIAKQGSHNILASRKFLRTMDILWGVLSIIGAVYYAHREHFGIWFWSSAIYAPLAFVSAWTNFNQRLVHRMYKQARIVLLARALS